MGTNYYAIDDTVAVADDARKLHIGKASVGWCFGLHVVDELGLHDLADWAKYLQKPGVHIENGYGEVVAFLDLMLVIENRAYLPRLGREVGYGYATWAAHDAANDCFVGPKNCLRRNIRPHHCIGHGNGTWDLITGEFS